MKAKPALLACASFLLAWFQLSPWSFGQYSPQLYIPSAHPAFEATTCIDSQNRVCIEWPTQRGYVYRIEDSETLDSGWSFTHFPAFYYGAGQRIRVPVYVIPAQPGDPPPIVDPHPNYLFLICSFSNHSGALISWHGPDAENHRAFVDLAFSGPLPNGREFPIFYVYTDAAATVDLLNFAYMPWDPSYAALSPATLPAPAADYLAELTSRYADMVASLPETPETSLSTPSPQTASGPHRFFRISAQLQDSDGDGLPDNAELSPYYNSDPFSSDTDGDGVSDLTEVRSGMSLRSRDTDGDGIPDGSDPNPLTPDEDIDHNGVPDPFTDPSKKHLDYRCPQLVPLDLGDVFSSQQISSATCDDLGFVAALAPPENGVPGPRNQIFWKAGQTLSAPENYELVAVNPSGPIVFRKWDAENLRWVGTALTFSQEITTSFGVLRKLGELETSAVTAAVEAQIADRMEWDSAFADNRERLQQYSIMLDPLVPQEVVGEWVASTGTVFGHVAGHWLIGPSNSSDSMSGTVLIPCLWYADSIDHAVSLAPLFFDPAAAPQDRQPIIHFLGSSFSLAFFQQTNAANSSPSTGYFNFITRGGKQFLPAGFTPRTSGGNGVNSLGTLTGSTSANPAALYWTDTTVTPALESITVPSMGFHSTEFINDEKLVLGLASGLLGDQAALTAKVQLATSSSGTFPDYEWKVWTLDSLVVPEYPATGNIPLTAPPPKYQFPTGTAKIWRLTNSCLLATAVNTDQDARLVLFLLTAGFTDHKNVPLYPQTEALSVSNWPGNGNFGFAEPGFDKHADDPEAVRIGIHTLHDPSSQPATLMVDIASSHTHYVSFQNHDRKYLSLLPSPPTVPRRQLRSDFLRLLPMSDDYDAFVWPAMLGDFVQVRYPLYPSAPPQHQANLIMRVGRPEVENDNSANPHRHDTRTVKLRIFTFLDPDGSVPIHANASDEVLVAQQIFGQAGVRLEVIETQNNLTFPTSVPGHTPDYSDGYDLPLKGANYATTDDVYALKTFLDGNDDTIEVFSVECYDAASDTYGAAHFPNLPHSGTNGINYVVLNMSKSRVVNTLAHELMHVFLNDVHDNSAHPPPSVFNGSGLAELGNDDVRIGPFKIPNNATIYGPLDTFRIRSWFE